MLVAALALTASSTGGQSVVRGQAICRERIALPPDAVFEATLEDVSRADAKADVLGTFRVEKASAVPIRFEIPYDLARVDPRHSYSVRARILSGDRLLFTTDRANPVLTRGHGTELELLLVPVRGTAPASREAVPLESVRWTLVRLGAKPVDPEDVAKEPHLVFQADPRRVAGSGGCNQVTGGYHIDGERLTFDPLATTRRACIKGMDTEALFLAALGKVRTFTISGRRLALVDDTGEVVAAFEAAGSGTDG